MLDTSTETGARAEGRLKSEDVAWLTTVRPDGRPQPVPVWFVWDGKGFLIFSEPDATKISNIKGNPNASVNLNCGPHGEDVLRAEGTATVVGDHHPAKDVPEYMDKYRSHLPGIGMTEETFSETYSAAIRVLPSRWMVW